MPEDPTWRKYFDEIPRVTRKSPACRSCSSTAAHQPRRLRRLGQDQCLSRSARPATRSSTITCPLGDLTSEQMRRWPTSRADMPATCAAHCRTEHRLALGAESETPGLYAELESPRACDRGAGTIVDVVSCPGTDTCKLGIASSRGLAGELRDRLAAKSAELDRGDPRPAHQDQRLLQFLRPASRRRPRFLRQQPKHRRLHRAAFPGGARRASGRKTAAHTAWRSARFRQSAFPKWSIASPSATSTNGRAAKAFRNICQRHRQEGDEGNDRYHGQGSAAQRTRRFTATGAIPANSRSATWARANAPAKWSRRRNSDFSRPRPKRLKLSLLLDDGEYRKGRSLAYKAMLTAAPTLVQHAIPDVPNNPDAIVSEFKARFVDTQMFWHRQHMGQFANYLLNRHEGPDPRYTMDTRPQAGRRGESLHRRRPRGGYEVSAAGRHAAGRGDLIEMHVACCLRPVGKQQHATCNMQQTMCKKWKRPNSTSSFISPIPMR